MKVILISPGFPAEMPLFTRGLAEVGAKVYGIGDTPVAAIPEEARSALTDYLRVPRLFDEAAVIQKVLEWVGGDTIDRVESLWEPGMILAAKLREALGTPGLSVEKTIPFRDKEIMKRVLDADGVRTPKHASARTSEEVREAVAQIGYPAIVKPIDGAGSADTYPLHGEEDLETALKLLGAVPEVSVEEFIEGEEYTFDTICADGRILFQNVAWYRPKPLVARMNPWISPQAICLADPEGAGLGAGVDLGHQVIESLGFRDGFTHMEWFLTPDGEAVFGEIGGRAPGARLVHAMNFGSDCDLFAGWAEAVCYGSFSQPNQKHWNSGLIFKRAQGEGIIRRIEGLESLMSHYDEHVAHIELTPVGQPKRDYRKVVVGDGWIVVRHPHLETTLEMADKFSTELVLHAE